MPKKHKKTHAKPTPRQEAKRRRREEADLSVELLDRLTALALGRLAWMRRSGFADAELTCALISAQMPPAPIAYDDLPQRALAILESLKRLEGDHSLSVRHDATISALAAVFTMMGSIIRYEREAGQWLRWGGDKRAGEELRRAVLVLEWCLGRGATHGDIAADAMEEARRLPSQGDAYQRVNILVAAAERLRNQGAKKNVVLPSAVRAAAAAFAWQYYFDWEQMVHAELSGSTP